MPKTSKRVFLSRGKGYLSAASSQYRFIVFLLIVLGIYTFLLKVFQKIAEIVDLPVFLPLALVLLLIFIGIVGTLYSHRVVGPIVRIRKVLDQVAEGDVHISLRLRESDEPLLQDLAKTITRLIEQNRNSRALIHDTASELLRDLAEFQDRARAGADSAEIARLLDALRKKQDLLEQVIKPYRKA